MASYFARTFMWDVRCGTKNVVTSLLELFNEVVPVLTSRLTGRWNVREGLYQCSYVIVAKVLRIWHLLPSHHLVSMLYETKEINRFQYHSSRKDTGRMLVHVFQFSLLRPKFVS